MRGPKPRGVRSLTTLPRTTLLIAISVVIVVAMLFANGVVAPDAETNRSTGGFVGFSLFGVALSAVLLLVAVPRLPADSRRLAVLGLGRERDPGLGHGRRRQRVRRRREAQVLAEQPADQPRA